MELMKLLQQLNHEEGVASQNRCTLGYFNAKWPTKREGDHDDQGMTAISPTGNFRIMSVHVLTLHKDHIVQHPEDIETSGAQRA
jgi:hypothetical protein